MRARALVLLAISLAAPAVADAADFTRVDLRPLLRVRVMKYSRVAPQILEVEGLEDRDVFVTKGGGLFTSFSHRSHPVNSPQPFSSTIFRGVASPVELKALNMALEGATIGVQTNCQLAPMPGHSQRHEIIWYGRETRRNQFVVFLHSSEDPSLARCPAGVFDFLVALGVFESAVASHPDSEVLHTPPL